MSIITIVIVIIIIIIIIMIIILIVICSEHLYNGKPLKKNKKIKKTIYLCSRKVALTVFTEICSASFFTEIKMLL